MTLLERARRLVDLLRLMQATENYSDPDRLQEMRTLNMGLSPVYERLYGGTPLINTTYPVSIWHSRALERASDALAWLEAHPGWETDALARLASEGERTREDEGTSVERTETPVAFLLMPFEDHLAWLHDEVVSAGQDVGVLIRRADDIFRSGVIIDQIKQAIRDADAIVAVTTAKNPNVFYELGLSEGLHDPILIAEAREDLPFDIVHMRAHFYGEPNPPNDRGSLRSRIAQALQETIMARSQAQRPGVATFPPSSTRAILNARIRQQGGSHFLEISNEGDVPLFQIQWELSAPVDGWEFLTDVLQSYPVEEMDTEETISVPAVITLSGPPSVELILRARTSAGNDYERRRTISVWGR